MVARRGSKSEQQKRTKMTVYVLNQIMRKDDREWHSLVGVFKTEAQAMIAIKKINDDEEQENEFLTESRDMNTFSTALADVMWKVNDDLDVIEE